MVKQNVYKQEFIRSLKEGSAEEIVDLYIYRPLGFVLAVNLAKTRITPNVVTIAGVFWGILAGFVLSGGTTNDFLLGAIIYQIANIFDCADGQLARLKSMYSVFGRILDGFVDYLNVAAVFVGSFIGLLNSDDTFLKTHHIIIVMLFAGISTAVGSAIYDKLKSKYINLYADEELVKEDVSKLISVKMSEKSKIKRFFYSIYIFYLKVQNFIGENFFLNNRRSKKRILEDREKYRELYLLKNANLLKIWSLVGPSTRAFYFLVFAAAGRISWYFLFIVGPLNAVLLILLFIQYMTEKSILTEIQEAS